MLAALGKQKYLKFGLFPTYCCMNYNTVINILKYPCVSMIEESHYTTVFLSNGIISYALLHVYYRGFVTSCNYKGKMCRLGIECHKASIISHKYVEMC